MATVAPRKAAMRPKDFRDLITAAGLNQSSAAERLDVNRRTVIRWLNGDTPISAAAAALIRSRIRAKK